MNQHYTKMKNILVNEEDQAQMETLKRVNILLSVPGMLGMPWKVPFTEMKLLDLYKKVQRRHFLNNGVVVV